MILVPALVFNLWRSERQTRKLTQILSSSEAAPKVKREHESEFMYLADDGEMLEIIKDDDKPKRAFRG